LKQARIPFHTLKFWIVPVIEIAVGGALAVGFYSRLAALVICSIMAVAAYGRLTVDDPGLFPLQPHKPSSQWPSFSWRGS
jgi:uncharacterized membrane protein YphA (DoxX/SURF4 family)